MGQQDIDIVRYRYRGLTHLVKVGVVPYNQPVYPTRMDNQSRNPDNRPPPVHPRCMRANGIVVVLSTQYLVTVVFAINNNTVVKKVN